MGHGWSPGKIQEEIEVSWYTHCATTNGHSSGTHSVNVSKRTITASGGSRWVVVGGQAEQ